MARIEESNYIRVGRYVPVHISKVHCLRVEERGGLHRLYNIREWGGHIMNYVSIIVGQTIYIYVL